MSQWKHQLLYGARELFTSGKISKKKEEASTKKAELPQRICRQKIELERLKKTAVS